ncbi:MAG TPA: DUF5985 family protein [Steroidobacteraceae bacterium]
MREFIWGLLSMETAVAALFFLRSWRVTSDRLFLFFALAFFAMMLNWVGLSRVDASRELLHYVYLFRLIAFVLIIVGIVDKNHASGRRNGRPGIGA